MFTPAREPHRWARPGLLVVAILIGSAMVVGCVGAAPSASQAGVPSAAIQTPEETAQPTPTPSPAGTPTPSAGATSTPSPTGSPNGEDAAWVPAGRLSAERTDLAAATLGDGRVLVVGTDVETYDADGNTIPVVADTVDLWEPGSDTWSVTASLPKRRFESALVSLRDGRALVIGGRNEAEQSYSSAYAFDPATDAWSKVGLMTAARSAPAAVVLADGRVLVAGGYYRVAPNYSDGPAAGAELAAYRPARGSVDGDRDGRFDDIDPPNVGYAYATAELFDPRSGTWSPTGSMRYARAGAAAVRLTDGRVLVVGCGDIDGAVRGDRRACSTSEIYDPHSGRFTLTGALPAIDRAAVKDAGVVLPSGDPEPAAVGQLVALDDGGALLIGHAGWWKHQADVVQTLRYHADAGTWSKAAPTYAWAFDENHDKTTETKVDNRLGAVAAPLPAGLTLVAGGNGSAQYLSPSSAAADAFHATTGRWADLPPMPIARTNGVAVALADGSVLVVGGARDTESEESRVLEALRFIPAS